MNKKDIIASIHAFSGAAAIVASVKARDTIGMPEQPIRAIGYGVFALGCFLFAHSLFYIRGAVRGNVDPVGDRLVTGGPYRFVRHPVYLAMLVMCLGLTVGMRSWLGIALTAMVFFPAAVYRARLEEAALGQEFGEQWNAYRRRTHFIVPFIF
jgi:protein-S-isoprenylcysteine O-methyltransferase Ste14